MKSHLGFDSVLNWLAKGTLPHPLYDAGKRLFLLRQARRLRKQLDATSDLGTLVDAVLTSHYFRPDQKRSEIIKLLELLAPKQARRLCEIGGNVGGSLALLARVAAPDARMLSVDLDYNRSQMRALPVFARDGQTITCLAADSHKPETLQRVKEWLAGEPLDFLFIDGDHSLFGVSSDFDMYAPLVRPGGVIAFHDIVPDARTRGTGVSPAYVGEVPAFWKSLKEKGYRTDEFVQSWDQDGFGIGVVYWVGARAG
jgi:predicted O-methyltransferase YrrM